jgi:hypothetical protein
MKYRFLHSTIYKNEFTLTKYKENGSPPIHLLFLLKNPSKSALFVSYRVEDVEDRTLNHLSKSALTHLTPFPSIYAPRFAEIALKVENLLSPLGFRELLGG